MEEKYIYSRMDKIINIIIDLVILKEIIILIVKTR